MQRTGCRPAGRTFYDWSRTMHRSLPTLVLSIAAAMLLLSCGTAAGRSGGSPSPTPAASPEGGGQSSGGATSPSRPSASAYGFGFQLDPNGDYDRALQLTAQAGFQWVKVQAPWKDLERRQGDIQWDYLDNVVNKTVARNLHLLLSVTTAPTWARPTGADASVNGPPSNPETYARFVGALAARYQGKVAAYEIWNEQNLSREWGGNGKMNARDYVTLLQAAYRAIKAADSQAIVVSGALTPAGNVDLGQGALSIDDLEYFKQMYQAGAKGFFDAAGVHASGFNNPPDLDPRDPAVLARPGAFKNHRSFYFRNFEAYHDILVQQGDGSKPIWLTEFGWASGNNVQDEWAYAKQNTEQQQADYLAAAERIARQSGYVGPTFVWNLNYFSPEQASQAFAVLKPDWSPRPAYQALTALPK